MHAVAELSAIERTALVRRAHTFSKRLDVGVDEIRRNGVVRTEDGIGDGEIRHRLVMFGDSGVRRTRDCDDEGERKQ